jgi:dihydrofolate reductase
LIAYGGGTLVSSRIAGGLLDELHLFVNPTATGAGMPVFPNVEHNQQLRLAALDRSSAGSPRGTSSRRAPDRAHPALHCLASRRHGR